MSRDRTVATLKNPEEFKMVSIEIRTTIGANWHYVHYRTKKGEAGWRTSNSLINAKSMAKRNFANGVKGKMIWN